MTRRVIFNHDAAIDEFMASVLLTTMESDSGLDIKFEGIVVTNADCIAGPAMAVQAKILSYIGRRDIPLSLSQARGLNPFPWAYRGDCLREDKIPALAELQASELPSGYPDGDQWLANALDQATTPLTLLVNCPLTTLRGVLDCPQGKTRASKIEQMIWMGGAIDVVGNLDPTTLPKAVANGHAEWNAFWDPPALDWIFRNTSFPITMFPLDVTNKAHVTTDFMEWLADQASAGYEYSILAQQSYGLVAAESFYEMWDVLTTSYLAHPELFADPWDLKLSVVTEGFEQGWIHRDDAGRDVQVVLDVADIEQFYRYVLDSFRKHTPRVG